MNGAPQNPNGLVPRDRTPVAVTVDNLIRRRLRIGDPTSPQDVADGLRKLFTGDARALDLEAKGLPLLSPTVMLPAARMAEASPSGTELDQATGDVERDLRALTTDSQLKDIEPELLGWGQAIRGIVADGIAAARIAIDPRSRDRAMGARRQLGDYARLARFVGALTCGQNQAYRRLAQSLDEVGAMILVLIGESLARIGFGGGRFLLQAPASELQTRRDAVVLALRNLNGATQDAYGSKDWPYGLRGLREVLRLLDDSGHADLRSMFDENTIARLMDDLLDRASTVNTPGLRALGATAAFTVQRLNRLIQLIDNRVQPGSPPLVAFLEAIRLFVDGFQSTGSGYRLLFIARPPAVFYGLYGIGGPDAPTGRLINLVIARGQVAQMLDCYLGCDCCEEPAICQVLLDKLLYDTDRAIDLYALGAHPEGDAEPEWRAAGYGLLIRRFLNSEDKCLENLCLPVLDGKRGLGATLTGIHEQLVVDTLPVGIRAKPPLSDDEEEERWNSMRDELCLQRRMDQRWGGLLATMAPACVGAKTALDRIDDLIGKAISDLGLKEGDKCPETEQIFPPTVEESFQFANLIALQDKD